MFTVSIGDKNLNAVKAYPYQYPNGKREFRFIVQQSEISYTDLKKILASNTGDIVITEPNGTSSTLVGYRTTASITDKIDNGVAVFYVELECIGEAERKAAEANAKVAELQAVIVNQNEQIALLNEVLLEEILYGNAEGGDANE